MVGVFHPSFNGTYQPDTLSDRFLATLTARVRSDKFLPSTRVRRNEYEILHQGDDSLHFRASTIPTALNVGLNDVAVNVNKDRQGVSYHVSYWTWTKYNVYLALAISLLLAAFLLPALFGIYFVSETFYPPNSTILLFGVPMILFWGLIWPWVLVVMHKRPARHCLVRIFEDVNSNGATSS